MIYVAFAVAIGIFGIVNCDIRTDNSQDRLAYKGSRVDRALLNAFILL